MNARTLCILCVFLTLAGESALADTVDIREWLVPWEDAAPTNPVVGPRGRVWFISQDGDFIGNFSPDTEEFFRYDLRSGTEPAGLLVDADRVLWYASSRRRHIGSMNPGTGRTVEYEMPERKARDVRSMAFDQNGDIWFTVEKGNFVGRLQVASGDVELIEVPERNALPLGITIDATNKPWVTASGRAALLSVDPGAMDILEVALPNDASRPMRIVTTGDGRLWYSDFALGLLGRYDPVSGAVAEWQMPGGENSQPFGMAVDRNGRIWIVETGSIPNRLVGFDTSSGAFLTETDIPSGAGSVSHLHYSEASGEVWFGTATNYIGRARVH